jgi:hypothetical protein
MGGGARVSGERRVRVSQSVKRESCARDKGGERRGEIEFGACQ